MLTSIGAPGFEPGTFWSQTRRATGLRYAPLTNGEHQLTQAATLLQTTVYVYRRTSTSMRARMARPRWDTRCLAASGASANVICRSVHQNSGS